MNLNKILLKRIKNQINLYLRNLIENFSSFSASNLESVPEKQTIAVVHKKRH